MSILVLGGSGLVGSAITRELEKLDKKAIGVSSKEINLKCSVEKYPSTIFLKRFNKVKLTNTSPQEILEQLNNKKL